MLQFVRQTIDVIEWKAGEADLSDEMDSQNVPFVIVINH